MKWMIPIALGAASLHLCAPESELIYEGRYWESAPEGAEQGARADLDEDAFYDLRIPLELLCAGERVSSELGFGIHGVRRDSDQIALDRVVYAGRDGGTFVENHDWLDYYEVEPEVAAWRGHLSGDGATISLSSDINELLVPWDGEVWTLDAPELQPTTSQLVGDVSGMVTGYVLHDGTARDCAVFGEVVFTAVDVTERFGLIWLEHAENDDDIGITASGHP